MKVKSVLAALVSTAVLTLGLIGCGGDDDSATNSLVGNWALISVSDGTMTLTVDTAMVSGSLNLKSDGTAIGAFTILGETTQVTGTWTASGTQLTVTEGGESEVIGYTLSGDTLTLSVAEAGGQNTMTFIR